MIICQFCKKNVATVHLTELVDGEKQEVHLCEECAGKKGLSFKTSFSLQDLLSGLMEKEREKIPKELLALKCPNCGLTFGEFRNSGRFGCPQDYHVFKENLAPLLERIHGSAQHTGKVPERIDTDTAKERALIDLKRHLEEAINREEYERAAEIRDRIRALESEEKKESLPDSREEKHQRDTEKKTKDKKK